MERLGYLILRIATFITLAVYLVAVFITQHMSGALLVYAIVIPIWFIFTILIGVLVHTDEEDHYMRPAVFSMIDAYIICSFFLINECTLIHAIIVFGVYVLLTSIFSGMLASAVAIVAGVLATLSCGSEARILISLLVSGTGAAACGVAGRFCTLTFLNSEEPEIATNANLSDNDTSTVEEMQSKLAEMQKRLEKVSLERDNTLEKIAEGEKKLADVESAKKEEIDISNVELLDKDGNLLPESEQNKILKEQGKATERQTRRLKEEIETLSKELETAYGTGVSAPTNEEDEMTDEEKAMMAALDGDNSQVDALKAEKDAQEADPKDNANVEKADAAPEEDEMTDEEKAMMAALDGDNSQVDALKAEKDAQEADPKDSEEDDIAAAFKTIAEAKAEKAPEDAAPEEEMTDEEKAMMAALDGDNSQVDALKAEKDAQEADPKDNANVENVDEAAVDDDIAEAFKEIEAAKTVETPEVEAPEAPEDEMTDEEKAMMAALDGDNSQVDALKAEKDAQESDPKDSEEDDIAAAFKKIAEAKAEKAIEEPKEAKEQG